jgi:hypothetical protein
MKKLRTALIVFFAAAVGLAGMVMWSCSLDWSEYTGVNLIADRGFDYQAASSELQWTADRTESYYMNFEHPSETAALDTDGLPSGTSSDGIYRLEIPNLVPNGDFENSTDVIGGTAGLQPQNWSEGGGSIDPATSYFYEVFDASGTTQKAEPSRALYGNSLYFTNRNNEQILYDLSNLEDGFIEYSTYTVHFELRSTYATNYEYNDGISTPYTSTPWVFARSSTYEIRSFPPQLLDPQFTARSGTGYFSIGLLETSIAEALQIGYIDNFRIVRADMRSYIYILIPAAGEESTTPALLDGAYEFSVYIRQDPTNTTGSIPVNNRMPASAVSLCAGYRVGTDGISFNSGPPTVFKADAEDADWSQWTKVTAYVEIQLSDVYAAPGETVYLELMIAPTDTSLAGLNRDAGSLLVAAPYLEYLPAGIPSE